MDDRDRVLTRIRGSLGRTETPSREAARADLAARLDDTPPRPQWEATRVERFTERLEAAAGSWASVAEREALPSMIAAWLGEAGEHPLGMAPHPLLTGLDWSPLTTPQTDLDNARHWHTAITVGYAGIAETGSIVLPSGPSRPTTPNFLPDRHIVVLSVGDIVDYMESVWDRLLADGPLPRTVNVITGPSRTADVEQTLQLGAHGPRQLHVLLLQD
ncbi:lactate utilization protein [Spiribacter sp. 218]|jgi:L-lactate utilization protein LutC|uniref:LutC/YkgG family protein n=1 Tax=Spiribacter pallidus TaxID=1987936 RepID=UPI00349F9E71